MSTFKPHPRGLIQEVVGGCLRLYISSQVPGDAKAANFGPHFENDCDTSCFSPSASNPSPIWAKRGRSNQQQPLGLR